MGWVLSSPQLLTWKPHPSSRKWAVGSVTPAFSGSLHLQPLYVMMRGLFDFQAQASAKLVAAGFLHKCCISSHKVVSAGFHEASAEIVGQFVTKLRGCGEEQVQQTAKILVSD